MGLPGTPGHAPTPGTTRVGVSGAGWVRVKVPVYGSSSVCMCVRLQVTHLPVFTTVRELVCTLITMCVSPSRVCKKVGPCVFVHVYEYMANFQCMCVCR